MLLSDKRENCTKVQGKSTTLSLGNWLDCTISRLAVYAVTSIRQWCRVILKIASKWSLAKFFSSEIADDRRWNCAVQVDRRRAEQNWWWETVWRAIFNVFPDNSKTAVKMERILRGIMRYRHTTRAEMVREFQKVRDNPEPKAVFFTCMDSRMIPTRFTWVQGQINFDADNEHCSYFFLQWHARWWHVRDKKCRESCSAQSILPRRALFLRTGRSRARLCCQRHSTHHCLRAQRLQSNESSVSTSGCRVLIPRKSNNFTASFMALYTCGNVLGEVSAFDWTWFVKSYKTICAC